MEQNTHNEQAQEIHFDPANMIALTRKLSDILEQEASLLKGMKITQIQQFYDDKIALTSILEAYKQTLAQNPELIKEIPERTRALLLSEVQRFEQLAEEDGKQIMRAKEVYTLVMEAVKRAVEKKVAMSAGYNKKGVVYAGGGNSYAPPAVSINESI